LYKYDCFFFLKSYMMFSSCLLLGFVGGITTAVALQHANLAMDWITFVFVQYNFAIVGVVSIFFQKGIPTTFTQTYLVITSVIMAYSVSRSLPEWTSWTLLITLALYDLCAVLSPVGPLNALVQQIHKKQVPLPGLVFEANVNERTRAMKEDNNGGATSGLTPSVQSYQRPPLQDRCDDAADMTTLSNDSFSPDPADPSQLRIELQEFYKIHNPTKVGEVDKIIEMFNGDAKSMWKALREKYQNIEESETIKLGLGDFVFYSVLVAKASLHGFVTMASCILVVLLGLCVTLVLLATGFRALPALPISVFLGVFVFLLMQLVVVDYIEHLTGSPLYI